MLASDKINFREKNQFYFKEKKHVNQFYIFKINFGSLEMEPYIFWLKKGKEAYVLFFF